MKIIRASSVERHGSDDESDAGGRQILDESTSSSPHTSTIGLSSSWDFGVQSARSDTSACDSDLLSTLPFMEGIYCKAYILRWCPLPESTSGLYGALDRMLWAFDVEDLLARSRSDKTEAKRQMVLDLFVSF